ncbi:hypothetical protein K2X89_03545, partial [Myxococcota bacterium]|nr:hypothetical protein [Myxococcota bacterium]
MQRPPSIDRHLEGLPDPPDARQAAVVPAVRSYLAAVREHLAALHRSSGSGRQVNETNSDLTDRLIRRLFDLAEGIHVARGGSLEGSPCVIAVGGYARREMSIHSDVDLLVLYREPMTPYAAFVAERLQYWLWDAGLRIGCATRTLEQTVELGREDVTVRTAVLTARFLCGDGEYFHVYADRIRGELLPDPFAFAIEQRDLMRGRHHEFGDSLFLLQPNIKEGAGGLRDYHAAYWVARGTQPSVRNVDDLLHFGLLTEPEMQEYVDALDFLWRTRNELHLRAKRANDRMSFELQEDLSEALGYGSMEDALAAAESEREVARATGQEKPDPTLVDLRFEADDSDLPVEQFMRDYYRHARAIKAYSELVIDQCTRRVDPAASDALLVRKVEHGFRIVNDQLMIPHAAHLREDPMRVLEAFRVAQRHQVPLSRMAQRLVRENRHVVDERIRNSAAASALFMDVLDGEARVTRTLT